MLLFLLSYSLLYYPFVIYRSFFSFFFFFFLIFSPFFSSYTPHSLYICTIVFYLFFYFTSHSLHIYTIVFYLFFYFSFFIHLQKLISLCNYTLLHVIT